MLEFEGKWRFDSPCRIEPEVVWKFRALIDRISPISGSWKTLEHFKRYFAPAAGASFAQSSSEDWASTDLDNLMSDAADNAALFIEAFYDACEKLQADHPEAEMPGVPRINRILVEQKVGFQIDPPTLVATTEHVSIAVPEEMPSLDDQAKEVIQDSLAASEIALADSKGRQAVQEVLWVLESISTAFRSADVLDGDIKGKYFNKIATELKEHDKGPNEQILKWMMALHGYLSSPTGGGVRHGANLVNLPELGINEARLYCNLIRSYTTYLIDEYERLRLSSS